MFKQAPWSSHKEEKDSEPKEEPSLTTILSTSQRSDLTLLIASATESMRSSILSTFSSESGKSSDLVTELTTEDDKIRNPNVDPSTADPAAEDEERKLKERREKELSAPKMKELKTAALTFFDDWRDSVLQRVGEVVNSRDEAVGQKKDVKDTPKSKQSNKRLNRDNNNEDASVTTALHELYPPIDTPLSKLEEEQRMLILHSMLLLILSLEHYIAHSRILLLYLTSSLRLDVKILADDETKVAQGLLKAAKQMSGDEETQKKAEGNKAARRWKVGLASVAGAAIIGVTGGLAAPLVAAGIGGVMGGIGLGATAAAGYLGTLAGSGVLVGSLFGAYGARMTGQMMDSYAKEVSDFAFIPVRTKSKKPWQSHATDEVQDRRLRVAIGISGWLTEKEEVVQPWRVLGKNVEIFALRWELEALMALGGSITTMVKSAAWSYAKSEIIKRTIFASLTAALWPIGLLKVSRIVDNPFSVAKSRSEKAGEVLADALINKAQGERPVTLVGYSLGARLIYSCLMSLADRKAFGLIESVVLIGAPAPSASADWRVMRSVVAGRVVNVYSENDYILGFLYRTSSIQYGVAGLQPAAGVAGVQNVDVSKLVSGHLRYRWLVGSILREIGFEDVEVEEVVREEETLKMIEKEEQEEERERSPERERNRRGSFRRGSMQVREEPKGEDLEELERVVSGKSLSRMDTM
ncbi:MAG: hypothetical protein M1819_002148 [Sarea resinae]|nr:MAG: hypothetical protein M1819_002148 [Sarea resinae]